MSSGWIRLNIEIVTHTFLDGPRDSRRPEDLIRGPSLKNALRRGLRLALPQSMAGEAGDRVIDSVFGMAADGDGQGHPSLIALRTRPENLQVIPASTGTDRIFGQNAPALNYLLGLGLAKYNRAARASELTRRCLRPGSTFTLEIRQRGSASGIPAPVALTLIGLRCIELYSGLGAHTSRGWGGIKVTSDSEEWKAARDAVPHWPRPGAEAALGKHFSAMLRTVLKSLPRDTEAALLDPDRDEDWAIRNRCLESANIHTRELRVSEAVAALADASGYLAALRRPVTDTFTDPNGHERTRILSREWQSRDKTGTLDNAPVAALALPVQYYNPGTQDTYFLDYSLGRFPANLQVRPVRTDRGWTWGSIFYNDWPDDPRASAEPASRGPGTVSWSVKKRDETTARILNRRVTLGKGPADVAGMYSFLWLDGLHACRAAQQFRRFVNDRLGNEPAVKDA